MAALTENPTHISTAIAGLTATGTYWHRVWHDPHSGQLQTWCSNDRVTTMLPKDRLKEPLLCWKRGCWPPAKALDPNDWLTT